MKAINVLKGMADELLQKTEDRKFKLTLLFFLTATFLVVASPEGTDWLTGADRKEFAKWLIVVFVGGNVGQKIFVPFNGEETK